MERPGTQARPKSLRRQGMEPKPRERTCRGIMSVFGGRLGPKVPRKILLPVLGSALQREEPPERFLGAENRANLVRRGVPVLKTAPKHPIRSSRLPDRAVPQCGALGGCQVRWCRSDVLLPLRVSNRSFGGPTMHEMSHCTCSSEGPPAAQQQNTNLREQP